MGIKSEKALRHIIWDWNGTLLDDVGIVVESMNTLMTKRGMPLLDREQYKEFFVFPVKDYYARLGFDFSREPFEELAVEYITEFNSEKYGFRLHGGVTQTLGYIRSMGIGQSVLSATKEQDLNEILLRLEIRDFFEKVAGLDNHYAAGKVGRGRELMADLGLDPQDVLMIGDTIHDYEVSRELGCRCLLVSNGHQSHARLLECNVDIVDDVKGVAEYLKKLQGPLVSRSHI